MAGMTDRSPAGSGSSRALLIVDMQNDFCPGGALPVAEGDAVVPVLNRYIEAFQSHGQMVCASRDWHPRHTRHFNEGGGVWPAHCIQDTDGALFHPRLQLPATVRIISKGTHPEQDAYSAFDGDDRRGNTLQNILQEGGVRDLYVGGLATDYCVKASVLDGIRHGYRVFLLRDAVRGVDVHPGDVQRARDEMITAGARECSITDLTWG